MNVMDINETTTSAHKMSDEFMISVVNPEY